jgi:NAD(P)-dependent dehydrogenase (short-subunit alcohol dehydrogenase family)
MESGMTDRIPEELQLNILKKIPLNSFGPVNEVIRTTDYLINTEYVAGTTIDVNGGLY